MNESIQSILQNTPSIGKGYTPGTSLATHVSYKLTNLFLVEIERLIKDNSDLNLASWRALRGLSTLDISSQKELVKYSSFDQGQMSRVSYQFREARFCFITTISRRQTQLAFCHYRRGKGLS
ncbi:hypothetical protein [Marinomonas sp. GJ51-6]|uniref:hypothetical protein n=1 Tax=Marinomonas sp. GJ51-6 TaxID=2992802 RepID=UPI0029345084|nr:hypothetical protein [Marinomonas sp. GJ51-6]WOD08604.1 hypothetical protein ONZ50_05840 [Marinomonas sp. GJ51-6]